MSKLVKEYQCPGCVCGPYPECYKKDDLGVGCGGHVLGTSLGLDMHIALGLPKGFCRGYQKVKDFVFIFDTLEQKEDAFGEYNKFNVAVWKHLDSSGNTLVRCYQPRINNGMVHVIKGDVMGRIEAMYTLSVDDLEAMD
jgi:hypothetical protein